MSFIETTSTPLVIRAIKNDACPVCELKDVRHLFLLQKYLSISLMPFVPLSKSAEIRCQHCSDKVSAYYFSDDQKMEVGEMRSRHHTPFWTFSGAALTAIGVIWLFASLLYGDRSDAVREMAAHPQQGDVYAVETFEGDYTWFRIDALDGSSAILSVNSASTPIKAGLSAIRKNPYKATQTIIHRKKLQSMYNEGRVVKIIRK